MIKNKNGDIKCTVPENNPYPPHGRSLVISKGTGGLKVKILDAKYEAKLEFPRGRGGGVVSMDIFWNCTILVESPTVK